MDIKISESIGFCFGVKHAVDLSKKALRENKRKVFSVGPIIHNPQVVEELSGKGLTPLDNIEDIGKGVIIISSHGAGAKLRNRIKNDDLEVVDATCPFVKRIQGYVKKLHKDGYRVIIVGKKEHPEVRALTDVTEGKALVIKDAKDAKLLKPDGLRIGIVSQSTYSQSAFQEVVYALLQKPFSEVRIFNTICRDTIKRQDTARRLAKVVDVMIVIGGKNSANTCRLTEVCRKERKAVYHIENENEIESSWFINKDSIGVTSGASTPDRVVKTVVDKIESFVKLRKVP